MLASIQQTLDDTIVRALAHQPAQNATELFKKVESHIKHVPTTQGWYKALRRLKEKEVIIKHKKNYSLNARWILSVIRWAQEAERTHLGLTPLPLVRLPTKGNRITFRFKNLLAMDTFWGHLLVYIASRAKKSSVLYAYNHHFWFYLAHEQSELQYNQGMKQYGIKTHMLIGSDSFLDRWSTQFFDKTFKYWLHPIPLFANERAVYNYFDGYFMEVKIPLNITKEIDSFFKNTQSLEKVSPLELIKLFHSDAPCSITISRSKTRGENLKRKVEHYITKSK